MNKCITQSSAYWKAFPLPISFKATPMYDYNVAAIHFLACTVIPNQLIHMWHKYELRESADPIVVHGMGI